MPRVHGGQDRCHFVSIHSFLSMEVWDANLYWQGTSIIGVYHPDFPHWVIPWIWLTTYFSFRYIPGFLSNLQASSKPPLPDPFPVPSTYTQEFPMVCCFPCSHLYMCSVFIPRLKGYPCMLAIPWRKSSSQASILRSGCYSKPLKLMPYLRKLTHYLPVLPLRQ